MWVGVSDRVSDGHVIVPITWNPGSNSYDLGETLHTPYVKTPDLYFPLRMGPVSTSPLRPEEWDENHFLNGFMNPHYKANEGELYPDERVEGEDPLLTIKGIRGKKGKGNKLKYLVEWEGSTIQTWEPSRNLTKYGASDMVKDYNLSLKKPSAKAKSSVAVSLPSNPTYALYNIDTDTYTTDTADRVAVEALIKSQKVGGTVDDWLPGYVNEMTEVTRRRLTPIVGEEVTDLVKDRAVKLRMVLERKRDGRCKGRLILQGFREPSSWDGGPTDSPVASSSSVRSLLFKKGSKTDVVSAIDVSVAFLQSLEYDPNDTPRYVYHRPHPSLPPQYYRLRGPIYGQRAASKAWFNTLVEFMVSQGFVQGADEPCSFYNPKTGLTVVGYVDDVLCRGSESASNAFYAALGKRFDCKDPSFLSYNNPLHFLGFDILLTHDDYSDIISVNMTDTVEEFLRVNGAKPVYNITNPMSTNYIDPDSERLSNEDKVKYQSIVGTLNYFATQLRYDISYATNRLSQHSSDPKQSSWTAMQRVLSFMLSTTDFAITGRMLDGVDSMHSYSDSDLAGHN